MKMFEKCCETRGAPHQIYRLCLYPLFAMVLLMSAPPRAMAGTAKTGGTYEIMSDTVAKSGATNFTGGTMSLSQTAGQPVGNTSSGGSYSLNSGFIGMMDEVPPTLSCSSPDALSNNTGSFGISGAVFDENIASWSVSYGPGASPSLWKQLTSGTSNAATATLTTWDASNLWGTYTIKIAATDSRGNTSTLTRTINVWNTYTFSSTIPADKWSMVSLPGNPQNPDPAAFLGTTRFEIQRWDPAQAPDANNLRYKVSFPVTAGDGFWIKPYKTPITYSVTAWVQDTTASVEKHLDKGWNQLGMPFNRAVTWGNFQFKRDGDTAAVPIATAITNGWVDSKFYSYSDNAYAGNDTAASLQPFAGYFVCAETPGTLILDPGAGMPGGVARVIRPVYDFRMQVAAETADARDTDNFIGEMKGASEAFGREDSAEPPTVKPFVSVYIDHPEWGRTSSRFTEDVRPTQDAGAPREWNVSVETDEPGKLVTLKLPDAANIPENYSVTVRDDATGQTFDPRATPEYSFTTGASAKNSFTITAVRHAGANPAEISRKTAIPAGWSIIAVPLETSETDIRAQLGTSLSKINIYQYYDRQLLTPESVDHVDIQAGVGYWAYAEKPVEVEFRGVPTAAGAKIDVPLEPGWNLVGNPSEAELPVDKVAVVSEGRELPLQDAATESWLDGPMYKYSRESGAWEAVQPGQGAMLVPGEGYAVKAKTACTLRFAL